MSYIVVIFIIAFTIPCESTAVNKSQSPDDPLLTMFSKQEMLLQLVQKQVNNSISELDSRITMQAKTWERAFASHVRDVKKLMALIQYPRGFFPNDFGCYKFIYESLSYDDATTRCRQYQSHLVELQSTEESEALISLIDQRGAQYTNYWLGGKRVNNVWTWSESKKPFTFTNWYSGEGDVDGQECASFYYNPSSSYHKKWWDDRCTWSHYVVCEI